jgi:PAS domain S-box-containing protein/CxxC-x17-CxxC domain-containing protein
LRTFLAAERLAPAHPDARVFGKGAVMNQSAKVCQNRVLAFTSKAEGTERLLAKVEPLLAQLQPTRPIQIPDLSIVDEPLSTESQGLQLLAAVVGSSDDAILTTTLDGTVLSWNEAAERMYGHRHEEIIGKTISILLPCDRPDEVREILKVLRRGQKVDHFETVRVAKDGRLLSVSLTVSPICDFEGRIIGASAIARDITHSKLAEQSMRNSEKLALAGRMAATVAHEINNPLEAATNALCLLEDSLPSGTSGREFLTIAQEELARIRQIATLTLGLHRGDAERPQQVKVPELIDNVLALYGRKLRTLGIAIESRYDDDVPVNAFPGELRQVFSNLIVNAADALEKSGDKLCIHVTESLDWTNLTQRGLRITISDNGCGIPVEKRARIFEPFYTTKGSKGTGIGLSVSLGIVTKYGGTIRFRSSVNPERSGTTFSIFLPVTQGSGLTSKVEFRDKVLKCIDCGQDFVFTAGEQLFFHIKQFKNDPARCKSCKGKRLQALGVVHSTTVPKVETRLVCANCGTETTVPFKPTRGRPVLCRECFQQKKTSTASE